MLHKRITTKLAALAAMALLCCSSILMLNPRSASAQPPPNCNCLTATTDPNGCLCTACTGGCYTWDLINTYGTCITSITIIPPSGGYITSGCAVVLAPTYYQWGAIDNPDGSVTFSGEDCWGIGGTGNYPMQITLCGEGSGANVQVKFYGGPAGCPSPTIENITIP
jgi:hypothetical protein